MIESAKLKSFTLTPIPPRIPAILRTPKNLKNNAKSRNKKKLEEQTKLAEQKRIQQQRQYETQIKREEELRLKQQQQYEEELRLSEKTRQSQSSFTEPDDDVELRLMLIEQLETLTLELNDKKKFLETLQQESKDQLNESSTQDLLRKVNELEDEVKKSKQNNMELSQAVETMSEQLYTESEAVTAFKASVEEDQLKLQLLLERRQELSNLLQLKIEQLNTTEEEHMTAFEALEQTQVPDEEPEPEPELEEEILMKKMLEEERLREEEEERLLREEEERLLREEEEERLIREEEERLNKEEQLKREEEERQRPDEEEKRRAEEAEIQRAKEESSQADFRNLLKKNRSTAPTPLPIKEEKKEEETTNDFRNLLKKRSVVVPPITEEKKEETSSTQQVDFRHLLKKKT